MSQESWVCGSFFLTAWYPLDLLILKERAAEELEVLLDALVLKTSLISLTPYCPPDAGRDNLPSLLVS
ncbi:hypothetical protein MTR67_003595 [Solanum verrucosum]|uniref:Uncharacterized protein n=1 Tax=Solanum verrucosum TaxID=315347 RepID=A0AAF0TE88_SOLVR|nr:hypothetical protein MTR67_003595 [Solanum verrucosum]